MYINLINMCRLGRVRVTCEGGVRLLGRTYEDGEVIKYRRRIRRNWLRRNHQAGSLEIMDERIPEVVKPEVKLDPTPEPEVEIKPEPEITVTDITQSEDNELAELNEQADESDEGSALPVIEAPLTARYTRESLEVLDFQALKNLAKPLNLTSNGHSGLVDKILKAQE